MHPTRDNILVKQDVIKTSTLIITEDEKPNSGKVIAVGPGAMSPKGIRLPVSVEVGDRVMFGRFAGTTISVGGEELLLMKEADILGVF